MGENGFDTSWLKEYAGDLGVEPLDPEAIEAVLTLAGDAAHDTGDRRNAPIACFLAGYLLGRHGATPTADDIAGP